MTQKHELPTLLKLNRLNVKVLSYKFRGLLLIHIKIFSNTSSYLLDRPHSTKYVYIYSVFKGRTIIKYEKIY